MLLLSKVTVKFSVETIDKFVMFSCIAFIKIPRSVFFN